MHESSFVQQSDGKPVAVTVLLYPFLNINCCLIKTADLGPNKLIIYLSTYFSKWRSSLQSSQSKHHIGSSYILRRPLKFDRISKFCLKLCCSVKKSWRCLHIFFALSKYMNFKKNTYVHTYYTACEKRVYFHGSTYALYRSIVKESLLRCILKSSQCSSK